MRRSDESGVTLVELLVVMVIFGIISAALTGVLITAQRTESFQKQMQEVMDDARVSFAFIRKEVRAARRIYPTSCEGSPPADSADATNLAACLPSSRLHFWVDQDQDNVVDADEEICYISRLIGPGQWELVRWTGAATCDTGSIPVGVQVIASTLIDDKPMKVMDPPPTISPSDAGTSDVTILLDLEVTGGRGPDHMPFESIIRLRNVA